MPLLNLEHIDNTENMEIQSRNEHTECKAVCCNIYPDLCNNYKKPKMVETSTQTLDPIKLDHIYSCLYVERTKTASTQCSAPEFSVYCIKNDNDSKFYTGLSLTMFMTLVSTLTKFGKNLPYRISIPNQILLVQIRLRLALIFSDIGRRFGISHQLTSNIFNKWIDIMSEQLSALVVWLPRETIRRTLPASFKNLYPKTTCIIDCPKYIYIQRPFTFKARAQTWSTYKTHNTAKFLIAIAPCGFIMYISHLYGGRASDNYITKHSGFLNFLLPGDEVMADRGFTIGEELCARRVKLIIIPYFCLQW
ncbi:uncharacterized protein LOC123562943 [Mercenaria mercenaria]|uniref:uncharacterized protein LOC123562943 n=1 Tax=Mercenaria mercenaria TaxID=6596 RepID=UPI001E1DE938|nr:uncharacterized protein LOC123562943 [Mercenaria mercenaria]